jgi:hypothetical protein
MTTEGADPFGNPLTRQREDQQGEGGTDGERDRQCDGVEADGARRTRHNDGGEHRPRARYIKHPQCQSQTETASALGHLQLGYPAERLLEKLLNARKDQAETDRCQCDEAGPPNSVLWKVQQ